MDGASVCWGWDCALHPCSPVWAKTGTPGATTPTPTSPSLAASLEPTLSDPHPPHAFHRTPLPAAGGVHAPPRHLIPPLARPPLDSLSRLQTAELLTELLPWTTSPDPVLTRPAARWRWRLPPRRRSRRSVVLPCNSSRPGPSSPLRRTRRRLRPRRSCLPPWRPRSAVSATPRPRLRRPRPKRWQTSRPSSAPWTPCLPESSGRGSRQPCSGSSSSPSSSCTGQK